MNIRNKKIIIIGGGFGGVASALLLAKAGAKVEIYEKNNQLGGRSGQIKEAGYTFDTGPSWILMPEIFEHYFRLVNIDMSKLQLNRLNPSYKVFYGDKSTIQIYGELNRDKETFDNIEKGSGNKLIDYVNQSTNIYNMAVNDFLYSNFDSLGSILKPKLVNKIPALTFSLTHNLDDLVSSIFESTKIRQLMEFQSVFLGSSPFELPAMYRLMSHLDFKSGVFYPQNGIYSIVELLAEECVNNGVKIHLDDKLLQLSVNQGELATADFRRHKHVKADVFVSNTDPSYFEQTFIDKESWSYTDKYYSQLEYGPSAIILLLGVSGHLPMLNHHNLLFVDQWEESFKTIFNDKQWPDHPSMYISKTSATDKKTSPNGCENIVVLIPGPAKKISHSNAQQLADKYLMQIEDFIGCSDFSSRIVYKKILDPIYFKDMYNSPDCSALGLSHRLRQSAFFRTKNKSKKIHNLYYTGANTLPGIGLPMCLISAENLYKKLTNIRSSTPLTSLNKP